MFKNNLKTAMRSLSKNKGFTMINILGLALGLTACFLILFYVLDEKSYDSFNLKADRIFRVNTDLKYGATITSRAIAAPVVASTLVKKFPEIENAIRIIHDGERFEKDEKFILEDRGAFADPGIFDVFTLPFLEGDPKNALKGPNAIVITESFAKKYFQQVHVVGKSLACLSDSNTKSLYKITGVIQDIPKQSHFNVDFFISMSSFALSYNDNFAAILPFSTYVLLKPGFDYKKVETRFPAFIKEHLDFIDALEKNGDYIKLNLTPLKEIHLQSNRTDELGPNGNIEYIHILLIIALFILIIACINFMNLSTARSANRAREVGVRKILGSSRKTLVFQFLAESIIISLIASAIALLVAWAFLPLFNELSGKELVVNAQTFAWLFPSLISMIIIAGLLAGSYPAFFLSGFRPIDTIKGKLSQGFKGSIVRNVLVVVQFSVSIFLIAATLVIYNQLHYIQTKDLGYDRKQVLILKNTSDLGIKAKLLKQEIKQMPTVSNATLSSFMPSDSRRWRNFIGTNEKVLQTEFWPIDEDYLNTMGIQLVKGRNFSNELATDSSAMIINETAARVFDHSDKDPLNKTINYGNRVFRIIGVVKDFNFNSVRENIAPLVMLMPHDVAKMEGDNPNALSIRVNSHNVSATLDQIQVIWKSLSPIRPLEYSFMDENFDAVYRADQRIGKIAVLFTTLAIFIACLGLFSLAAYAAEQRAKEISIRKILGADVITIVKMLLKEFLKLVGIAILIASPAAWLLMQKWLENYAYRINIHWWVFAVSAVSAMMISFVTISYQSIKSASANPTKNLRLE